MELTVVIIGGITMTKSRLQRNLKSRPLTNLRGRLLKILKTSVLASLSSCELIEKKVIEKDLCRLKALFVIQADC
jgi:hypothetical protein